MDRRLYYLLDPHSQAHLLACETTSPAAKATILIIPPLLEEMNACRRHISEFASQAQRIGFNSLYVDLLGTGDSELELADIDAMSIWQANIATALDALDTPVILLAIRTGALLLTPEQLDQYPTIFWQPVVNGKRWVKSIQRTQQLTCKPPPNNDDDSTNLYGL